MKPENTQGRQVQNNYAPVPSRLARTNPNAQQTSRLGYASNPSNLLDFIAPEPIKSSIENLPNKVSALDKNVLFQDVDRKKGSTTPSANNSTIQSSTISNDEGSKAMGLISNAFLGATNKFMKGNIASTPVKVIEQVVEEVQEAPKVTPPAKFSRNKEQLEVKNRTISMKVTQPEQEGPSTDRSQLEGAKKIERRPAGGRELRFTEKKEEKVESTPEKIITPLVTASKKVEVEVKTEVKEEEAYPRLYQQPAAKPERIVRSRIVTEAPKQEPQPVKEPSVEPKTKEIVKPAPVNRLVASRLQQQQQNLVQSKVEESKVSESKVSQKETISKPTPIKSNIRLTPVQMTEPEIVLTPPPAPKEQIKPKPYSRSFITRKNETTTEMATSSVIQAPSAVKPSNNPSNLSQSNITKTPQSVKIQEKSKVEEKVVEQKQQSVVLKRSVCAALIIKRLILQTLSNSFLALRTKKQVEKAKKVNECLILSYSMTNIAKIKEINLIKLGFQNIKKKFTASYITSLKSFAQTPTINYKNTAITLLDRLYSSKVRNVFRVLKESLDRAKNRHKCASVVESFTRKKLNARLKDSLVAIQLRQKNRIHILNQFSVIVANANKNKLANALSRIAAVRHAAPVQQPTPLKSTPQRGKPAPKLEESPSVVNTSNQALIDKLEKLKSSAATSNSEISTIQSNIQKKKKGAQSEKSSLLQRITVLKHQNDQINNEIQIKKHRSQQIKKEMQTMAPKNSHSLEEQLTYSRQNKLQLLTNLYVSHYKNTEESLSLQDLVNTYNLKPLDSSSLLFSEWTAILHNVQLKRTIAAYEGTDIGQNKGRTNLLSEQALTCKLIRSYIKEQYFWNWIHLSAQNI